MSDYTNVRKWYFATNVHGLRHAFDQIQVAVTSNRTNAGLLSHCIVDDAGGDQQTEANIRWLIDRGVEIIRHRASMLDVLIPQFKQRMNTYSGHWLRCDIPNLETEDRFVLYTDIDVMFLKTLPNPSPLPKYVACAPEFESNNYAYFNSGVMVMNIGALRERDQDLKKVVERRLAATAPWDDQGALNELFEKQWLHLPPIWNWKPYWGPNDDALILHFHGPKPAHAASMRARGSQSSEDTLWKLLELRPDGYAYYLNVFSDFLASA
jgi:lipopolysaccharide biosynthesis glycosyltransferase